MSEDVVIAKKRKTGDKDATLKIFHDFLEDENQVVNLQNAYETLVSSVSTSKLALLKINECNARSSEGFPRASCSIQMYRGNDFQIISYAVGTVFENGLFILKEFLDNCRIPEDTLLQDALKKLLIFTSLDHSALLEDDKDEEGQWVVKIAQHMLLPLSVTESYTIDDGYNGLSKYGFKCPCEACDPLKGRLGDTSFGIADGWHGRADILVNDVAVNLSKLAGDSNMSDSNEEFEIGSSALSGSQFSASLHFQESNKQQIIAQCIVSSFLQCRERNGKIRNCLVPAIGISKKNIICYFYDCENDVLLGTPQMELLGYKSLWIGTTIFLWLTLNYRLLLTGITDEMKMYKAEFVERVGDYIKKYREDVGRNVRKIPKEQCQDVNWALVNFSKPAKISKTGEELGIKLVKIK